MPRYFFHLHDGGSYVDEVGHELDNQESVRMEAMRALPDIARDAIPKDGDKQGYMILVTDADGDAVYSATLNYTGVWLRSSSG